MGDLVGGGDLLLTSRGDISNRADLGYAPRKYLPLPTYHPIKAREQVGDTPLSKLSNFFTV
jgi:hypothetical protein